MSKTEVRVVGSTVDRTAAGDLLALGTDRFRTVLADPPWRFQNRTGKMAPEHRRLSRYGTMSLDDIMELPVPQVVQNRTHLYLWVPNALILEGLEVLRRWGFTYKTNIIWYKTRKDGGPDGRGVGFYFRNVTEMVLFGVRGTKPYASARSDSNEHHSVTQTRTLAQAGRTIHDHRTMFSRAVSRDVCSTPPRWMGTVGK